MDFVERWAFGIKGTIEKFVRDQFPQDYRTWPLVNAFVLEPYDLPNQYAVFVLKDRLSGLPVINGMSPFPHSDHPKLPPKVEEIELWQFYLKDKMGLRPEDAAFLVPVRDSGEGKVQSDFALFSPEERMFWAQQMSYLIAMYKAHIDAHKIPDPRPKVANYLYGPNPRVNMQSHDSSVNVVHTGEGELFDLLRTRLDAIEDEDRRTEVAEAIDEMENAQGSDGFVEKYKEFVGLTADHMGVFGPLIPALSNMLG